MRRRVFSRNVQRRGSGAVAGISQGGRVRDEICLLLRHLSDPARPDMIRLVFAMRKDLADKPSSLEDIGRI